MAITMIWISVKDELPIAYVDVLVYPYHDVRYSDKLTAELQSNGCWLVYCEDSHQCYEQAITNVTHWMHIPSAPTKQGTK